MISLAIIHLQWGEKIIKLLVEYGVNINVRDSSRRTSLHWTCQEGYTDELISL